MERILHRYNYSTKLISEILVIIYKITNYTKFDLILFFLYGIF